MTDETTPEPAAEPEPGATVQMVGEPNTPAGVWHLVTYGGWQISVAPDGLLMLPRHLHPREWADFVAAGSVAVQVGTKVIADNEARAKTDDRSLPAARAIIREGPPPPGAARMLTTPGPNQPPRQQSTIGRARRNGVRPRGTVV
jgi:hypothetical protein